MLISWMMYATLLGALVAAGALALERAVAVWSAPRRGVWLTALALTALIPLSVAFRPSAVTSRDEAMIEARISIPVRAPSHADRIDHRAKAPGNSGALSRPTVRAISTSRFLARWTRYAAAAWITSSLVMFALLFREVLAVRSRRKMWRTAEIDGRKVLVADDVGPAVVGVVHPAVVIPTWALALGDDERTLMLHHESEHVASGDPVLLLVAALVIVALPWNAALWFLVHRLRLAIEIDCDARVLRAVGRPREYGMLLLAVGSRRTVSLPLAVSLAERRPLLERRILAMTSVRPAHPAFVSSAFIGIAGAAAALAAQTPRPVVPPAIPAPVSTPAISAEQRPALSSPVAAAKPPASVSPARAASPARAVSVMTPVEAPLAPAAPRQRFSPSAPQDIPIEVIRGWIERYHPSVIAGDTSIAVVTVVVSANDEYISSVTDKLPDNVQGDVAVIDPLAGLRVEGIENIQLLKGAAAAAEYGPEALNGVVVVTTKAGLANPARAATDTAAAKSIARIVRLRLPAETANIGNDPIYVVDGVVVNPQPAQSQSSGAEASLERIGVPSDGIGSVEILKLAPGRIGPNALRVVLVKLRDRG